MGKEIPSVVINVKLFTFNSGKLYPCSVFKKCCAEQKTFSVSGVCPQGVISGYWRQLCSVSLQNISYVSVVLEENNTFQKKLQNSIAFCLGFCWGFFKLFKLEYFSMGLQLFQCKFYAIFYQVLHNLQPLAFKATSEGAA